jgi:O-methyltransferase
MMKRLKEQILRCGLNPSYRVEMLNLLFEIWKWLRANPFPVVFESRYDLYRYLNHAIIQNGTVDYLEFGVWEGLSIKAWSELNSHPQSRFFGFDTFEGLPEEWKFFVEVLPIGSFDAKGKAPELKDRRVRFIKGLFQDVLPEFLKNSPPQHRLVVNCDADLYTSTLYVLASLHPFLEPGSIVIFDEITTVDEFRAFRDFTQSFRREYRLLASAERLFFLRAAIEFI